MTYFYRGEPRSAHGHFQDALALCHPENHRELHRVYSQDPAVVCHACGGLILWTLGFPARALSAVTEGLRLAEGIGHPFTRGVALLEAATLHRDRREPAPTAAYCLALEALCAEHGFALWRAMGEVIHGWADSVSGRCAAGIERIRAGIDALTATGATMSVPYHRGLLAEAYARGGQLEAGLATLDLALADTARNGLRLYATETHRLRGELLLKADVGATDTAEAAFQEALAIAHRQEAKSLELRAAASLARLWLAAGRAAEAKALLGRVYGGFSEGFDTPDLLEAQALLHRLD